MSWVVVDDPVPTGASHLGTGLGGERAGRTPTTTARARRSSSARSRAGGRTTTTCRRAVSSPTYDIRLNQPGTFELPPTRVEALYAPDLFGEAPNATWEVR